MPRVPLGKGAYNRTYANEPEIRTENYFFEENPTNAESQSALLTRPGSVQEAFIGEGTIRGCWTQPGAFDGDLFVAVGSTLYRYASDGTKTTISGTLNGDGACSATFVSGSDYEHIFISDGLLLQYYEGLHHASGTLQAASAASVISDEVVNVAGIYYSWCPPDDVLSTWTSTGWSGDNDDGYTHTVGNTTALTNSFAPTSGTKYSLTVVMSDRSAGSITVEAGGAVSNAGVTATTSYTFTATSTDVLTITPTSDFDGTVVVTYYTTTSTDVDATYGTTAVNRLSSSWTSTGWTGNVSSGWTHTVDSTSALTNAYTPIISVTYTLTLTVSGVTAGTFSVSFGGESHSGLSATAVYSIEATTADILTITPTADFDGTVVVALTSTDGQPDGSEACPYRVQFSSDSDDGLYNNLYHLYEAIMAVGTAGTTYSSTLTVAHSLVTADAPLDGSDSTSGENDDFLTIRAVVDDATGDLLPLTVTGTSPVLAVSAETLEGGGTHVLSGVEMPDGVSAGYLCTLASYVVASVSDDARLYWIRPAETRVRALDYATAENEPDKVVGLVTVGDVFYAVGQSTIETWYATGDGEEGSAFAPVTGRTYPVGAVPGTAVKVKGTLVFLGTDNIVYAISSGLERISNCGIEERVRKYLNGD